MTTGLSKQGKQALAVIERFLKAEGLKVGEGFFASPAEWQERGEQYSRGALLVVVYDGATDLRRACSLDGYDYDLNDRFQTALQAAGFRFEEGTGWYGGVYPAES